MSSPTIFGQERDPNAVLKRELDAAEEERRPTSRHELAEIVAKELRLPYRESLAAVDVYCDINAPGVPDYLSGEFSIGWLKVLAFLNVVVSVVLCGVAVSRHLRGDWPWPIWALAVVFGGLGVFIWVKSLEDEVSWRRNRSKTPDRAVVFTRED